MGIVHVARAYDLECRWNLAWDLCENAAMVDIPSGDLNFPLTEGEYFRLDRLLLDRVGEDDAGDREKGVLGMSELDGFCTAIASGPVALPSSTWLPAVWGDFEPVWEDESACAEIVSLLTRHLNVTTEFLKEQASDFEPIFGWYEVDGKSVPIVDDWCEGYYRALLLAEASWNTGGEKMEELLTPILAFTSFTNWEAYSFAPAEVEVIQQYIPANVKKIHAFWQKRKGNNVIALDSFRRKDKKVGRNDPCPCGSGKKYKKCCLLKGEAAPSVAVPDNPFDDLRRELGERVFDSVDEVRSFMNDYSGQRNRAGVADFHGLSPEQMHGLLYEPFASPELVSVADEVAAGPDAPIVKLFAMLVEAIGDKGLKCTAKGNLPRAFCKAAWAATDELSWNEEMRDFHKVNKEVDFTELHVTRLVSREAGLVRKYKGRFLRTRECERLLDGPGLDAVYVQLFRACMLRHNWACTDRYPAFPFIQQAFFFSLFLLQRYGGEERPHTFYEDAFLAAFPKLLEEAEPLSWSTPEDQVRRCYTLRTLARFARFLGLASLENRAADIFEQDYRVTKTPLLDQLLRFHLQ